MSAVAVKAQPAIDADAALYDSLLALRDELRTPVATGLVKEAALTGGDVHAVGLAAYGATERAKFVLREVEAAIAEVTTRIAERVAADRGANRVPRLHGEATSADELLERLHEGVDAIERAEQEGRERIEATRAYEAVIAAISAAKAEHARKWHERGGGQGSPEDSFDPHTYLTEDQMDIWRRGNPRHSL